MDRGLDKIENILNKIKKIERPKDCSFSSGMAHRVIWQIRIGIPIALGLIALLNHRTRNLIPQDFRYLLIATIVLVVTGIIYYLKIDDNSDCTFSLKVDPILSPKLTHPNCQISS